MTMTMDKLMEGIQKLLIQRLCWDRKGRLLWVEMKLEIWWREVEQESVDKQMERRNVLTKHNNRRQQVESENDLMNNEEEDAELRRKEEELQELIRRQERELIALREGRFEDYEAQVGLQR